MNFNLRKLLLSYFALQTPLHLAVKQNKPNIVSELLHSGAAPSVTTTNGDSSYHLAVRLENSDCLAILLKHTTQPSDLNIFNDLGKKRLVCVLLATI